jgi:uncharacterized protein (TIGR00266 family)
MQTRIEVPGAYAMAYVSLSHGESIFVERDGLVAMSSGIEASTSVQGSVLKAALRKAFAEESFFMARYTAHVEGAWVAVAPKFPGDITTVELSAGRELFVESGALLALSSDVDADVRFAGISNVVLREGATMVRLSGTGTALFASYGSLLHFELPAGQQLVVDTGHLVAFTPSMSLKLGLVGGAVTAVTSGEGIAGVIAGPGEVFIQTRAERGLRSWLFPTNAQDTGNAK